MSLIDDAGSDARTIDRQATKGNAGIVFFMRTSERTTEEIKYLTGIEISKSAQQRLVHRQEFEKWDAPDRQ